MTAFYCGDCDRWGERGVGGVSGETRSETSRLHVMHDDDRRNGGRPEGQNSGRGFS